MLRRGARRAFLISALLLLALLAATTVMLPYARSAAFLIDVSGVAKPWRRWLPARTTDVSTEDVEVPTRYGPIAARIYRPASPPSSRTVLVFPGVHPGGLNEPRLAVISRRLAATGLTVVSIPLPELRAYKIAPPSTDQIEDAVLWATDGHSALHSDQVSLVGVSFAGGLALVAAARPPVRDRIRSVVSIGGQGDLPRVLTYLCTGQLPDGHVRPPHDYAVAVLALAAVPKLVPAAQTTGLAHAVVTFLDASSQLDAEAMRRGFDEARAEAERLDEPARSIARLVNDRDVRALGPRLLPFVEDLGGAAALSPDRSPAATVPVFLLHGADDNVIPSSETPLLARYLGDHGNLHVRALLTPIVTHASVLPTAPAADIWRLVSFWKEVLGR